MKSHEKDKVHKFKWKDVEDMVDVLFKEIMKTDPYPDVIVAVAQGGVIPALMLQSRFGNIWTSYIRVMGFSDRGTGKVDTGDRIITEKEKFNIFTNSVKERLRVLIVDDVCQTGDTFNAMWKEFDFAVTDEQGNRSVDPAWPKLDFDTIALVKKESSLYHPAYVAKEFPDDVWVEWPWER